MRISFTNDRTYPLGVGIAIIIPYLVVILLFSGVRGSASFILLLSMCTGIGYFFLRCGASFLHLSDKIIYSCPVGFLILATVFQLSAYHGYPSVVIFVVMFVGSVPGLICFHRDVWEKRKAPFQGSIAICAISAIVVALYFALPNSRNVVLTQEGGLPFLYLSDCSLAVVTNINTGFIPPRNPGFFGTPLVYHYGPYALAAFLSKAMCLSPSRSLFHVVQGMALLSIFVAAVGLSRSFMSGTGSSKFSIPFGLIGLFFVGSFTALFSGEILPKLKGSNDGMVNLLHYMTSTSLLWAHVGLIAFLGVLLAYAKEKDKDLTEGRRWGLLVLPALLVTSNIFSALYALGLLTILLIWMDSLNVRNWLRAAVACILLLSIMYANSMLKSTWSSAYFIEADASLSLHRLFGWTILGLGIRIYAFQVIKNLRNDPRAVLVLVSTIVSMILYLIISDPIAPEFGGETDQYFLIIWQGILGLFAMVTLSQIVAAYFRGDLISLKNFIPDLSRLYVKLGIVFLFVAFIYLVIELLMHTTVAYSIRTISFSFLLITAAWIAAKIYKSVERIQRIVGVIFLIIVLFSLSAWAPTVVRLGFLKTGIRSYLTPGEVKGLWKLRDISQPEDLVATNHHYIFRTHPFAYGYSAISERQMLLEGWLFNNTSLCSTFKTVRQDNDLLFSTLDQDDAQKIVLKYGIKYVLCEPGTDIHFLPSNSNWLQQIGHSGSLKLYRVISPEGQEKGKSIVRTF